MGRVIVTEYEVKICFTISFRVQATVRDCPRLLVTFLPTSISSSTTKEYLKDNRKATCKCSTPAGLLVLIALIYPVKQYSPGQEVLNTQNLILQFHFILRLLSLSLNNLFFYCSSLLCRFSP